MRVPLAYGEVGSHGLHLIAPDGVERVEQAQLVLLSRLDYDVRCLELPMVPSHEIDSLIRYRIRSVYPGDPKLITIDHRTQRRSGRTLAFIAIIENETLAMYRASGAQLVTLAEILRRSLPLAGNGRFLHVTPRYLELLRYEDSFIVESRFIERTGLAAELANGLKTAGEDGGRLRIVAGAREREAVESLMELRAFATPPEIVAVESLRPRHRGIEPAFRLPRKRGIALPPFIAGTALAGTAAAIAIALFYRYVGTQERELELHKIARTEQTDGTAVEAAGRADALRKELWELIEGRPSDAYLLLSGLRSVLGPDILVTDLVVKSGSFQLQAQGIDPLAVMERFSADVHFKKVRLLQTSPIAGSRTEQFTVSGIFQ